MFDFRYHALTLVAVFLALAVGIILGVAIGDKQLVSGSAGKLRENLRAEVVDARSETRAVKAQSERVQDYAWLTLPNLVENRLEGKRTAVIFLNGRSQHEFNQVRFALSAAGGELVSASTVRFPIDLEGIGRRSGGTRYDALGEDPSLLKPFARRMGEQLVAGGRLLPKVRRVLFDSSSGKLEGAEAVVIIHGDSKGSQSSEHRDQEKAFTEELIKGLSAHQTPVVGVESTKTTPSRISWYKGKEITSVDNVDEPAGRVSLVYALSGEAEGTFGVKRSSQALLPDALTKKRS